MKKLRSRKWKPGNVVPVRPATPTEFDKLVEQLRIAENAYLGSDQLRHWCELNSHRLYVPEWLLAAWDIVVDSEQLS